MTRNLLVSGIVSLCLAACTTPSSDAGVVSIEFHLSDYNQAQLLDMAITECQGKGVKKTKPKLVESFTGSTGKGYQVYRCR